MARPLHRLTALGAGKLTAIGRHADGGGLYLSISENGGRRWVFISRRGGRMREMGLGSARDVTLATARAAAAQARADLIAGRDPIALRRSARAGSNTITFDECAAVYVETHRAGWKNPKHAQQWPNTLKTYASPIIGAMAVATIATDDVLRVLQPIWHDKTETAGRVRGRIEQILDWARVKGYRVGENPARWRGHLAKLLPSPAKIWRVEHHAAMAYADIPAFMAELREADSLAALAMQWTILTCARTGETIGARWREIDTAAAVWTVPAERMKAKRLHRVALSAPALAILEQLRALGGKPDDFLFPGKSIGKGMSNGAMLMLLERMGRADVTTHGMRSAFRQWVAECTTFPREIAEMALAHDVSDDVERAYQRSDLLAKRGALAAAWGKFCTGETTAKVIGRIG